MKTAKEFLEDWLDEDVTHRQQSMIGLTYYDVIEVMEAYKNQEKVFISDNDACDCEYRKCNDNSILCIKCENIIEFE